MVRNNNGNNNGNNNNELNTFLQGYENNAGKLAVIAGIITTLGDALATMAAVLALEEAAQAQNANGGNGNGGNGVSMDQFKELEKQVRYLTKETNRLKYPKQ